MLLMDQPAIRQRPAGVVIVSGHDRLSYLHNLLSQDLESASPGTAADFLYLDAKGNALAVGRALIRAGDVLLVTEPDIAADLAANLRKFTFLLDAPAEDVTGAWALASIRGPEPIAVDGARDDPMTSAPRGGGLIVRDRSGGIDLVGPTEWVKDAVADLDLPEASADDWQAWRILAGEPAWGSEVKPGRRTQELGLLPTHVHMRKGCYPGQESIAKTYNLGRPRRALHAVSFDGPVTAGDQVELGDGKVGEITSAAAHDGRHVALALLPLDRDGAVPGADTLAAGGATGQILRRVGEGLPQPGA